MQNPKCVVCGTLTKLLEKIVDIVDGQTNITNPQFIMPSKRGMEIYKCPKCTHMQLPCPTIINSHEYNPEAGQAQYIGTLDMMEHKLKNLKKYSISAEKLLDIGCGTGYALNIAKGIFNTSLGVEPAKNTCEIAKSHGFNVINDFFSKELNLQEKFSAFISCQVFEHLSDELYSVLNYAYEVLEEGGVGLINVPNGQTIINEALFHQLVFDHVNYFTPYSLAVMVNNVGFDILEINNIQETIEIDIYVKKPVKEHRSINAAKARQKEKLNQIIDEFENITIWGAGAKSLKYATLLEDTTKIKYIVDSSLSKVGQYIGGINVPITTPTQHIVNDSNLIIIFASSYNKEIIKLLRDDYSYNGDIVIFEESEIRIIFNFI